MTARIVDLLALANTWAQPQTFNGQALCKSGLSVDNAKTQPVMFREPGGLNRFSAALSNDAAEDFSLSRFDNAGVFLSEAFRLLRGSGKGSFPHGLFVVGENVWRDGACLLSQSASQGGLVLPNGFAINWGNVSASSGSPATVTLTYGYATAHVCAIANGAATSERFNAERLSLGQVKVYTTSGAGTNVSWLSLGY